MFFIKYLKTILYILGSILLLAIIIGSLSYFNIINNSSSNVLEIIAINLSLFIGGVFLGRNSSSKGYLEGIKIGVVALGVLLLLNLVVFNNSFFPVSILFYLLILISPVAGSILGINKKSN